MRRVGKVKQSTHDERSTLIVLRICRPLRASTAGVSCDVWVSLFMTLHVGFYEKRCWQVEQVLSPELFYHALPCILEEGAVIFFSSYGERDDSTEFLDNHLAPSHLIEPVELYASSESALWSAHCLYTQAMQKDLKTYFQAWNTPMADNIVCYHRGKLLLWFHDALTGGDLQLADSFSKDQVARFCAAMSPPFELILSET
jgi:hypothetical protein